MYNGQQHDMEGFSDIYFMKILTILKFMGETGIRFKQDELSDIFYYIRSMIASCRVIELCDNETRYGYLFFSICNDIEPYYKKPTWRYVSDNKNGDKVYIEKLVAKAWNKELRKIVEKNLHQLYPNLVEAIWHRWGKTSDRKVIYTRPDRRHLCMT